MKEGRKCYFSSLQMGKSWRLEEAKKLHSDCPKHIIRENGLKMTRCKTHNILIVERDEKPLTDHRGE